MTFCFSVDDNCNNGDACLVFRRNITTQFQTWWYVVHAHVMVTHRTVYHWRVYQTKSIWCMVDANVRTIQKV